MPVIVIFVVLICLVPQIPVPLPPVAILIIAGVVVSFLLLAIFGGARLISRRLNDN